MAVMPALAWGPGDPRTPYHLHSCIRLDHTLHPETGTPYHYHYQPRHLPHVAVCFDYNHHGDYERYVYVDLHEETIFVFSSSKTEAYPLAEVWVRPAGPAPAHVSSGSHLRRGPGVAPRRAHTLIDALIIRGRRHLRVALEISIAV